MDALLLLENIINSLNAGAELFAQVKLDRLENKGISAELTGGENRCEYLSGGVLQAVSLLFLAKSENQRDALYSLWQIYGFLTLNLPQGGEFVALEDAPALVDGGENAYLYEMRLSVGVFSASGVA